MHLIRTWFHSHSDDQKRAYVEDILDSKFVLCSVAGRQRHIKCSRSWNRGRAMGGMLDPRRGDLGAILEGRQVECMRFGARAREVWEQHFSEQAKFRSMLRTILELKASWCAAQDYRERWDTWRFQTSNDWLPHQRLASRLLRLLK
jgi:hypothetical protein